MTYDRDLERAGLPTVASPPDRRSPAVDRASVRRDSRQRDHDVWGQNVFVIGNIAELGNWNTGAALALSSATYPVWRGTVNLAPSTTFEYKYIKKDGSGNVTWESGANRSYTTSSACTVTLTTPGADSRGFASRRPPPAKPPYSHSRVPEAVP